MSSLRAPGPVEFALFLLLTSQWGTSYLAVKLAIGTVPEFTIVLSRAVLAGLLCYAIARWRHEPLPTRRQDWLRFAFAGFFAGVVPFVLIGWASRRIDTGLVSIILATQTMWTMACAHVLTHDEKIDARKAVSMFQKVNVPILGIVENMSYFLCPGDGKEYHIFGKGGGEHEAKRLGVPLLGQIPIEMPVRECGDEGHPIALDEPGSSVASKVFHEIAAKLR